MDTADHLRDASPWRAEPDPIKLAILGKLAEELGELQAAVARCIIQGVDGVHPVTGKPNIDWLREEKVDVENMILHLDNILPYTEEAEEAEHKRFGIKCDHILDWLSLLESPDTSQLPFDESSKEPFVVAERLGGGWAAVHYWWNTDAADIAILGAGFWEPWDTGPGRHATVEEAIAEAREYANAKGLRYRPQNPGETA